MGMGTPGYVLPGTVGPMEQERQQGYVNDFNNSAYAPIPGILGSAPPAQSAPLPGGGSPWNSLNGRLLGDTYLPPDVNTVDVGNGWYEVHHGGQRVGTLRPGGANGRFLNDTNWQMPQPGVPSIPTQPGGGGMTPQPQPPPQPFSPSGPYGNQAAQMAGLLAQPQQPAPQQPTGGLLGDPKRGFRIPGGK